MSEISRNQILLGASEELLKSFHDCTFDAIVTDPPYGLGTREPTATDIEHYLRGEPLDTGGDFMGKPWEIPTVPAWKEYYRVLKPGGYLLSFAGTRTWDIMSMGIRAAGFENRDTISSAFGSPCLQWLHGQGFPKSLNISKKLREMAKKEKDPKEKERMLAVADKLEGFGTALKPAWEPILCFRKPIQEDSVAEQAAVSGAGGINIDGTRVKHSSPEDFAKHKEHVERIKEKGGQWGDSWKNSSDLSGANDVTTAGRWPPNVVLTHTDQCKVIGKQKVDAPVINRFTDGMKPFGEGAGHPYEQSGGGKEEIDVYECAEGCPVKALDVQSGNRPGAYRSSDLALAKTAEQKSCDGAHNTYGKGLDTKPAGTLYTDAGGASRFFAQFLPDAPFFYTGKASKREKNEGMLEGKVSTKKGERLVAVRQDLKEEETTLLVEKWPSDFPAPSVPLPEWMVAEVGEDVLKLFDVVKPEDNNHPTVKPVSLMRWLVKMVTPKGGLVLDPYCGSGTTCVAALEEGCDFIGIDKDALYHKLASKRLNLKVEKTLDDRAAKNVFEMMMSMDDD